MPKTKGAESPSSKALNRQLREERVPDWGSNDSRLVLVGEAPGFWERVHQAPFVGPSGRKLAEWWALCTPPLDRSQFKITNVLNFQPLNNKIATVGPAEMLTHIERLHNTIANLSDPWLLVPTGNTALRALTGNIGITRWRGSILSYTDRRGRTIKVIPTIHPAQILRVQSQADADTSKAQPIWERACRFDWQRIAVEQGTRELDLPSYTIVINPTLDQIKKYEKYVLYRFRKEGEEAILATDIETVKKGLYCVGFALDEDLALVVNWHREDCRSDEEHQAGRALIRYLWEGPVPKATQNGISFDAFIMERRYGIRLRKIRWDCMHMHHALDPADRHSLEYMTSVLTRMPFYKLEAKQAFRTTNPIGHMGHDRFVEYCGRDCIATRKLVPILKARLKAVEVAA